MKILAYFLKKTVGEVSGKWTEAEGRIEETSCERRKTLVLGLQYSLEEATEPI